MKIFKNRGDIYVPKTKSKFDLEQRILIIGLVFIVIFTMLFVGYVGLKYDFSAKKFFAPNNGENQNTEKIIDDLPEVSGKENYLFVISNENTNEMYLYYILQMDMDTLSYKCSTFTAKTKYNNKTAQLAYQEGGAGNVKNFMEEMLNISIDYYVDQTFNNYKEMYDFFGETNVTILNDIKYKDTSRYGFNISFKAGERKISGSEAQKILRYYVNQENNLSAANEIILASVSQHFNEENYGKRESLFSRFIENSDTNITVKDFSKNTDNYKVLSNSNTGVTVYNVVAQYDNDIITSSSISELKGYFAK